jgi:hypothetical protein
MKRQYFKYHYYINIFNVACHFQEKIQMIFMPRMKITPDSASLLPLLFFYLIFQSAPTFSQDNPAFSPSSLAEKVYLQLDNIAYTTDQTIWFKAIVANAASHTPSQLSGVLYVELIDPNKNIVERKLIKILRGTGEGFFQLSAAYPYGTYQVRAYTEWNKNFDAAFLFQEYIQVLGPEKEAPFSPIKKLTIIEGQRNERRLNVQLDPSLSDSISGKGIQFVLEASEKKDTLSVKRNRSNEYLLNYIVPAQAELLTLQVETDNEINYAKTIVIDTNYIDLQFFPESGELVQGLPAVLAFKSLDYEGRGAKTEGEIINAKGEVISLFKTNELGMGSVRLGIADSAAKYTARIVSKTAVLKNYSLPRVAAMGNSLSVKKNGQEIILTASSNYLTEDSITVRATCRGITYFDFKGKLKNGSFQFPVDDHILPEGIIDFTLLLTPAMTPVAERLYFNKRPEERMSISVSSDKKEYVQREKTEVTITTRHQNGQPIPASVSLLVVNQSNQGTAANLRQNILSYFLLSSDLKGEIENPGYYFAQGAERSDDLDFLLLTQGWRKYNYAREPVSFKFQPEVSLTLSGDVKGGLSDKKKIKGAELTMMAQSKLPFFSTATTDSLGRFRFLIDDEYGDQVGVVIQSANKANKKIQYTVTLDKKEPPPIVFNHSRSIQKPDSIIQAYIKQSIEDKKAQDAYRTATEGIILEEVIVKSRVLSPEQKEVNEKYGEPAVIISGKEIEAKEDKWSYGLYSVLMFHFPDKVNVRRLRNGGLYASLHNGEPTLVVIDGIPVSFRDYRYIPGIPPSEVKSFELIPYAKNFTRLLCEVMGRCPDKAPPDGNVIAIYTYAGKGLFFRPTVGISKMEVPVFSKPREFYAPRHEQLKPEDWQKPDLRNLVHWDPKIKTDTTGTSLVSFYNSDNSGTIKIVVEAISANGEIGYSELFYDVRKRNLKDASR